MRNKYRPNSLACGGCPQWDDVNGCWNQEQDIRNCALINEQSLMFDDDLYEGMEIEVIEDEEPVLPITLQLCKDHFDKEMDNTLCKEDPDYDLEKHLANLGLPSKDTPAEDILVIDCPHCGAASYYNCGFTDTCSCCGYYNLADHSEEIYTLLDYWAAKDETPF